MNDFKIVIDGKECSCTKSDKVRVEIDSSIERSDIDCSEIKKLIDYFNIQREPITCTIHIKKKSPNHKRMRKFFKKIIKDCSI